MSNFTLHKSDKFDDYLQACDPDCEPAILRRFAESPSQRVRLRVAENQSTPAELLEKLSQDPDPDVRLAVGANPRAPVDITYALAFDADPTVRYGLAEDASLPPGVLRILCRDQNPYVACRAMRTIEALNARPGLCKEPVGGNVLEFDREHRRDYCRGATAGYICS